MNALPLLLCTRKTSNGFLLDVLDSFHLQFEDSFDFHR